MCETVGDQWLTKLVLRFEVSNSNKRNCCQIQINIIKYDRCIMLPVRAFGFEDLILFIEEAITILKSSRNNDHVAHEILRPGE